MVRFALRGLLCSEVAIDVLLHALRKCTLLIFLKATGIFRGLHGAEPVPGSVKLGQLHHLIIPGLVFCHVVAEMFTDYLTPVDAAAPLLKFVHLGY